MSKNYFIYKVKFLGLPERMQIFSQFPEEELEEKILEILEDYYNRLLKNNKEISIKLINSCASDLNKLVNGFSLNDRYVYLKLFSYKILLPIAIDMDMTTFMNRLNGKPKEQLNDLEEDILYSVDIARNLNVIDIKETINHLDKYLIKINTDYELYPSNKKEKVDYWFNNPDNIKYRKVIDQLIKSEKAIDKLFIHLRNNGELDLKIKDLSKAKEKLDLYLWRMSLKDQSPKTLEVNFKLKYKPEKFGIVHNFEDVFNFMTDIDSVMERFKQLNLDSEYSIKDVEETLNDINSLLDQSDFNNPKVLRKRFLDIFNSLSQLVHNVQLYDKSWIIHEIMQAIALNNTESIGLTPTKEGFTDAIYKNISEISKLRHQELTRKYMNKNVK